MSMCILLASVGAGKTARVLHQLHQTLDERPFARIWVLLATRRQKDAFRQRLIEADPARKVFFNVEFFNFYELYQRLLDMSGNPQRQLAGTTRHALLQTVINNHAGSLQYFGTIAQMPGFVRIVASLITELKQNQIFPEKFEIAARDARERDLALIYTAYQDSLRKHNLVDVEGQGWLAVEALSADLNLADGLALLLVDGYDQFTPVQADLLSLMADRTEETLITLTSITDREATVGRRFQRAFERLKERFPKELIVEKINLHQGTRPDDLQHLVTNAFLQDAPQRVGHGQVRFIEAPNPQAEAGAVLREVKRLLLEGVPADEILIAIRDWERYRVHFTALQRKYGLPLALHYGQPLAENPAVVALLDLITLHADDFQRRDLLSVLRSPYFELPLLTSADVDLLERISQQYHVVGGQALWLNVVRGAFHEVRNDYGDTAPPLLSQSDAAKLAARLDDFFAAITPPDNGTIQDYVLWVDALIGKDTESDPEEETTTIEPSASFTMNMIARIRDKTVPDEVIARDLLAINEFKRVLKSLLTTRDLLEMLGTQTLTVLDWQSFHDDLLLAVDAASINPQPNHYGRVLVTTVTDARGLPHDHVFILGLSEGLFPSETPEDPLFLDSERASLQIEGGGLETRFERTSDDSIFYELLCLSRSLLVLSRPTVQDGQPWAASPLWRASQAVFSNPSDLTLRLGISDVMPVMHAAALDEASIAIATSLTDSQALPDEQTYAVLNGLLADYPDYWAHIDRGWRIETGRLSRQPFNQFSGKLADASLIAEIRRKLGQGRVWSASQLNDYGMCGFRYFAGRMLRLETLQEPEEGMDVAQRGTLNHDILERTYRVLAAEQVSIIPENLERARTILRETAAQVFVEAPARIGFRESALWQQDQQTILRKLEKLVESDFTFNEGINKALGNIDRTPYVMETAFGVWEQGDDDVLINLGDEVGNIRVRGKIDRIDRSGDEIIIIDYKSGTSKIQNTEMEEGRNFQMLVYMEGAQKFLSERDPTLNVGSGLFLHIPNRETSGVISFDDIGTASMQAAKEHLARYIAAGRDGDFAVSPNKPNNGRCVRYCEFSQLCRMSSTHRHKQ